MAVPEEVKRFRPVNTTVYDAGRDGPKRFFVRERIGCKYIKGHNPQPVYGKVIGYIYEGKFIPKGLELKTDTPDSLSFGSAAFAYSVCEDLKQELFECFDLKTALELTDNRSLRVLKPRVPNSRLNSLYERSWISMFIPGMQLSGNTVSKLLKQSWKGCREKEKFLRTTPQ